MEKIIIIDGHSQIYRAMHSRVGPLKSCSGESTRGIYVFIKSLYHIIEQFRPTHMAIAYDGRRADTFRRKLYPAYKQHRDTTPTDTAVITQISRIMQIVKV